ncbi:PA2169 family four-helix-bundle protein [Brevundimonas sp.]|uniref:PA2169 family four-helix-bundle protein n=1 Tax=Brevundimonas sp. TaxID=1871086 RepID=UPI002FC5AE9A
MSNANHHDIHVLNGLIQTAIDSADGYRLASGETDDPGHRDLFGRRSFERRQVAEELQSTVRALGGDPAAEGSILAKAQRAFADVKHALMRDETGLVGAVEIAEDAVRTRFEKALEDSRISATTRETIRRAYSRVSGGRDEVHELRHSLESRRDAGNSLYPH